jgi:hypothetical protein
MTEKEPEGIALEGKEREYLQYDADIETLKNFMQKLGDKESLDKFFIQQGVISLYKQLREEIIPPRDIENAYHRILVTDSGYENPSDYKSSCDDNPDYFE